MDDSCPTSAGWRLSLVIPAFNEAAVIRQAIAEADEVLARLTTDYEVLIVDDGSRDNTAALVEDEATRRPHVRLLRHGTNRGYGAALRTGFEAARFPLVSFTDADCQFYLDDLSVLLPLTSATPIAAGFRSARQDTRWRRLISWGYNTTVRALLGTRVRDCDCALKVFRRETLIELLPESSSFFVNTEMLARARQHGFRVAEAGVRHRPRANGVSKVSFRDVPRVLRTLLPFWWSQVLFPGRAREMDSPQLTHSPPDRLDCCGAGRGPRAACGAAVLLKPRWGQPCRNRRKPILPRPRGSPSPKVTGPCRWSAGKPIPTNRPCCAGW